MSIQFQNLSNLNKGVKKENSKLPALENAVIKEFKLTEVIEKYKELKSMNDTCKFYNISPMTLRKHFNNYNVDIIGRGYASQKVIYNPFENATKEDKGYWVGFIAGDGFIESTTNKNRIGIVSKDKDIIDKFVEFTQIASVYTKETKTGIIYVAKFSNKDAKTYLVKCGIISNKSTILKLSVVLDWNIFRGLFDADGSLSGGRPKITTGSPYVVVKLETFLNNEGFKTSVVKKGNAFDVYILSDQKAKINMLRLLRTKMYPKNVKYYLDRKKKQMDALCSDA